MHDPMHQEYFDIADLPGHYLKEVEHFFHIYKDLEGKRVEILGWENSEVAMRVIGDSVTRYQAKYGVRGKAPVASAPVVATTPVGPQSERDLNAEVEPARL
jgi:hypothetical protein